MRVALVPVKAVRAQGLDVRVARFGPSPNLSYAMFSGGGLGWAEAAMKRGEFAVAAAPPGEQPDLSGLSCRFEEIPSVARPHSFGAGGAGARRRSAAPSARQSRTSSISSNESPDAGRPVPLGGPEIRFPPKGMEFEARAARGGSLFRRRSVVFATSLWAYVVMRFGIKVGNFVPKTYLQQVVENSDFRKYDDGLRMILDCTPELERELTQRLTQAASSGIVRYGLHRQDAAMMTCFTPSVMRSDHVHFIDGARGGYASAATALKATAALDPTPDARPGLAAAERADAAFDPQRIRARHGDVARVGAAVVGVVDLARPFAGT